VLKYHEFNNIAELNGTTIVTFDLENTPYLVMFTRTGVLKQLD
jgi:hypothetical protein